MRVKYSAASLSSYTIQHSQELLHVQNLKVQAILYLTHQVSILLGQDLCCFYATLHNSVLIFVRCVVIILLKMKISLPEHDTV